MSVRSVILVVLLPVVPALAQVVSYEADSFPEEEGWDPWPANYPADRWLQDGLLVQYAEIADPGPPELPEQDTYFYSLAEFAGSPTFFVEWNSWTDGPQEGIPSVAPSSLVAFGTVGVNYHTTISEDLIRILRDIDSPLVFVPIEPGVPHTYRIELYGDSLYLYYIDGELVDSDTPVGPYPTVDSEITFRGMAVFEAVYVWWDYIRFGVIPADGSGDFNSDSEVDSADLYFFQECLETEAGNWVACAWADFDADGDVDCDDWDLFQLAWTDLGDPPAMAQCSLTCPADLDGSDTVDAGDLALLLGAWGPGSFADLNGDDLVNASDLAELLGAWGACQ